MVNTEQLAHRYLVICDYNILNIVVNTELVDTSPPQRAHYNILNIVVNTEQLAYIYQVGVIITY